MSQQTYLLLFFFRCHCSSDDLEKVSNYTTVAHFALAIAVIIIVFLTMMIRFFTSDFFKDRQERMRMEREKNRLRKEEERQRKQSEVHAIEMAKRSREAERLRQRLAEIEAVVIN